jgi:hypothetical protein
MPKLHSERKGPPLIVFAALWALPDSSSASPRPAGLRDAGQELEPRAYSASPIGTNFLLVGVGRSNNVTRRAWAAVDATWYGGVDVRVDGGSPSARQNNARLGATLALPVGTRQSLKLAYSTGASTRTGADLTTVAVAWQYLWFDRTSPKTP